MKLFDSTILVAHLRGVEAATQLLREAASAGEAACSSLNVKHFPMVKRLRPAF